MNRAWVLLGLGGLAAGAAAGAYGLAAALAPTEVILGRYETALDGREPDQKHNAALSLRAIRGAVVKPGEEFSFNKAVGSWSRDKGFRRAPVSFNGSLIDAWGGGVCQTSTTLYNAALTAGLPISERHSHRFAPSYVPPGRDSAVAYPSIDLRFVNDTGAPLRIAGRIAQGRLIVELIGRGPRKSVSVATRVLHRVPPDVIELGTGRSAWVRSPGKPGWEVETTRTVDGRKLMVSRDSYPVMRRVVEWTSSP